MNLVVDANIVFSCLIKEGKTIETFLDISLKLYTPEFILEEIEKHKKEILSKTKRTQEEFEEIFDLIKQVISIIPKEEFKEFIDEAKKISPDVGDIQYFALALKLNCAIWSNDRRLKKGQNKIMVYPTSDLTELVK